MFLSDLIWGLMVLLLVGTFVYVVYDLFNKGRDHSHTQENRIMSKLELIAKSIQVKDQTDLGLAREFLKTDLFTTLNLKATICVPYLIETIVALLDSVEVLRVQFVDWTGIYVVRIMSGGVEHLLIIESQEALSKYYTSDKFNLAEWVQDEQLVVANSLRLLIPHQECDSTCQIAIIESVKEAMLLATIKGTIAEKMDNTLTIFELGEFMGTLKFMKTAFEYLKLEKSLTRLSFNPIPIVLGNSKYAVPADETISFFADELRAGRNVIILGPVGTGKTSFATNIVSNFTEKTALVRLDESTLVTLDSPAGKSAFHNFVAQQKQFGTELIIFFVDEGQKIAKSEHLTPLLELMAGLKQAALKTAVLGALSCKQSELDPALVRKGRAHNIVELTTLDEKKARSLAQFIEKNTSFVLNRTELEMAVKKPATLADVWGCFSEKEAVSKYAQAFYKYQINQTIPNI